MRKRERERKVSYEEKIVKIKEKKKIDKRNHFFSIFLKDFFQERKKIWGEKIEVDFHQEKKNNEKREKHFFSIFSHSFLFIKKTPNFVSKIPQNSTQSSKKKTPQKMKKISLSKFSKLNHDWPIVLLNNIFLINLIYILISLYLSLST